MSKVIGIDLGTTNSCMAVIENGEPVIIPNNIGERTTPSIVAFSKFGDRLVGSPAKRQMVTNPNRTIASVKRHMGSIWSVNIDDKKYNAQMISAFILKQLKKDAEEFLGEAVEDAVITVPAYFTDSQRQATKDAGRIAGLNVLRIINEPTSAALSYGLDHAETQKVMVFDLGGGTFDVSVIEIEDGVIDVLSTCGDNHLGGDDFDMHIVNWIVSEFQKQNGIDISKDSTAYNRVKEAAEAAKKELSTAERTNIVLPFLINKKNEPIHLDMTLTRAKFEQITLDLLNRTVNPMNQALSDAGIKTTDLSKVLLVGGSTRIPSVFKKVEAITGITPSKNINPDECVAVGAAILGSTLAGENVLSGATSRSLLLMDVVPMSLSLETLGGVATRLIERNSTIPTRTTQVFTTTTNNARYVEVNVLQGERPMARDNKSIGKFKFKGIQRARAGVPRIEVTFDIDVNGILNVSAIDLDTHQKQSVTITAADRMTEEEIEKAIRDSEDNLETDLLRRELNELRIDAARLTDCVNKAMAVDKANISKSEKKTLKNDIIRIERIGRGIKPGNIDKERVNDFREAINNLADNSADLLKRTGFNDSWKRGIV